MVQDVFQQQNQPFAGEGVTEHIVQPGAKSKPTMYTQRAARHLKKVMKIQATNLELPKSLDYKSWADPESFFKASKRSSQKCIIVQVYEELRQIDVRAVEDPIRQRLYAVSLFDLHTQAKKSSDIGQEHYFTPRTIASITETLVRSGSLNDSNEMIRKSVELYLKFGQKMKAVATHNGGLGALMVIPGLGISPQQ